MGRRWGKRGTQGSHTTLNPQEGVEQLGPCKTGMGEG